MLVYIFCGQIAAFQNPSHIQMATDLTGKMLSCTEDPTHMLKILREPSFDCSCKDLCSKIVPDIFEKQLQYVQFSQAIYKTQCSFGVLDPIWLQ